MHTLTLCIILSLACEQSARGNSWLAGTALARAVFALVSFLLHCISPLNLLPPTASRAATEAEAKYACKNEGEAEAEAKAGRAAGREPAVRYSPSRQPALSLHADFKEPPRATTAFEAVPMIEVEPTTQQYTETRPRPVCPEATASHLSQLTLFWFVEYVLCK